MNDVLLIGLGLLGLAVALGGSGVIARFVAGKTVKKAKPKENE